MQLGTSFIDHFIRGLIPSGRKILPWHSHPVAKLSCQRPSATATTSLFCPAVSYDTTGETVQGEFKTNLIGLARQLVLSSHIAAQNLATTPASRLLLIPAHFQCSSSQTKLAECGFIDILPCVPFNITVNSFSNMPRHLQKHLIIAHTESPLPTIPHCRQVLTKPAALNTLEERKCRAPSANTIILSSDDTMGVVYYQASVNGTTQMERHADLQHENTKRLGHGWLQDVGIVDKLKLYLTRFLAMLTESQHIRKSRLERINTAKHRIELLGPALCPVHSAHYRDGQKTCKFEKAKIEKMLDENIIAHAETE